MYKNQGVLVTIKVVPPGMQPPGNVVGSISMPSTSEPAVVVESVADANADGMAMREQVAVAPPNPMEPEAGALAVLASPRPQMESDSMEKLTDGVKQIFFEYVKRMEKVDTVTSDHRDRTWIPFFIKIVFRPDPPESLTKRDVLVWIRNCPEIFAPEVIANLREVFNQFRRNLMKRNAVDVRLKEAMKKVEKDVMDYKEQLQ